MLTLQCSWAWTAHALLTLFTCCFTCMGCMKLTQQTLTFLHLPFDVCLLVSSTVFYETIAACKVVKLYISTTQGMLPYIYYCTFRQNSRTSGSASSNATSTLPVIISPVYAFSPLESAPSFRSHTPGQTGSCHPGPSQSIQQGCN